MVPLEHYGWNIVPFDLKITPLEFQKIMDENFNHLYVFIIVFIIDVLIIKTIKTNVKPLAGPKTFKIVGNDISDIGYVGILKQIYGNLRMLVMYTLGTWNTTQLIHNTIKKEILSIVLCISKF